MILCDTNVLIEFYKNNPGITADLRQIGLGNLAVSVITVAELYYGALNKSELKKIKENLGLMRQIPVTRDISLRFLELMETYSLSHRPGIPDMLIAATALDDNLSLFTLNVKDFQYIPDLKIYKQAKTS
jgi:predicted nucleic acid-binding protein